MILGMLRIMKVGFEYTSGKGRVLGRNQAQSSIKDHMAEARRLSSQIYETLSDLVGADWDDLAYIINFFEKAEKERK
jgi:hypothetical protein